MFGEEKDVTFLTQDGEKRQFRAYVKYYKSSLQDKAALENNRNCRVIMFGLAARDIQPGDKIVLNPVFDDEFPYDEALTVTSVHINISATDYLSHVRVVCS